MVDGERGGAARLPRAARSRRASALEVALDLPDGPGERFVTFRFFLRAATDWAPAGHEVAWQQLALPSRGRGAARPAAPSGPSATGVLEAGAARAAVDLRARRARAS